MGNLAVNLVLHLLNKISGNSISLLNLYHMFPRTIISITWDLCNKNVKTTLCQQIHRHLYFPLIKFNVTCSGKVQAGLMHNVACCGYSIFF